MVTDRIDGVTGSQALKSPCRVSTTANIVLSGAQTIDSVAVVADDRVLVKDQTDATENGIYDVSATAWTRAKDFDGNRDVITGTLVFVINGTVSGGTMWGVATTSDPIVIDTDNIAFSLEPMILMAGTSSTSNSITVAAKTFATQAGLPFRAGQFIIAIDSANSANYLHGQVTSYSGTALVINTLDIGGSGTKASWNIYVSAPQGTAIGNNSVANTNLAQMAANTVKMNNTGSTADPSDVALAASQLIGRGASGNAGVMSVGNGLSFSGSTLGIANYQDKTSFTPVIIGTSTSGAGTYTTQRGTYSRIGNIVFYEIYLLWTAHTGTGNLRISGLPVTSATASGGHGGGGVYTSNLATGAGKTAILAVNSNATTADLYAINPAGGAAAVAIDAAAELLVSGFYFV